VSQMTDEQIAEGLASARQVRRGYDLDGFARLALALQERLQAAEAESAKHLTAIHHAAAEALEATRRASVAEAERDEARERVLADVADERAEYIARTLTAEASLSAARQQARREAFEEAALKVLATRATPESLNNWWFGVRADLAAALRVEAPKLDGEERGPGWCAIHQHYKKCVHSSEVR
jgi:hypothetical protein